MKFNIIAEHDKAVIAALKARWPSAQCGGRDISFPSYFAFFLEEDINPYSVRDEVASVAPEVNEEMCALWLGPTGQWFQLEVNPALARH